MRSYEQIDREKEAYVTAANKALSKMRDKSARWWNYSFSHSTFDLVVGDPQGNENILLSLAACEYLAGAMDWNEQQIEVIFKCDRTKQQRVWNFILQDESAGFKAIAGVFEWRKNFNLLKHLHLPSENVNNTDVI
ncbi:MAG TPA: hypothetical protein VGP58_09500 [Pyrinomonadaceae bacterium]|nr:hypothetical protein [Pyrinomonadaceae bacterium]